MIEDLYTYLDANKPTGITTVKKGWEEEALAKESETVDTIFLSLGDEDLEETDHDFVVGYWATQYVTVIICCDIANLDARKTAVRAAALGWSQSGQHTSLQPAGGQVVGRNGDTVYWAESYFNEYQGIATP